MIKYLQRLKHKKGFTLVELAVVIAIISVLAAIMIPSLYNMLLSARVTGVNFSAAQIRKNISAFMVQMTIDGTGMKRGGTTYNGKKMSNSAQIIWSVNEYNWLVKTECKPCYLDGSVWRKINGGTSDVKRVYNDPDNWYKNDFQYCGTNVSRANKNHLLALTVAVREAVSDLKNGFIMGFFDAGICRGIVYIPEWRQYWPSSSSYNPVSSYCTGMSGQMRPRLIWSWNANEGVAGWSAGVCLPEMSPWHGVWPYDADDRVWENNIAGVDAYTGMLVGTSPTVLATPGRRPYNKDHETGDDLIDPT